MGHIINNHIILVLGYDSRNEMNYQIIKKKNIEHRNGACKWYIYLDRQFSKIHVPFIAPIFILKFFFLLSNNFFHCLSHNTIQEQ